MTKMTTDERDDLKMWARLHVRGGPLCPSDALHRRPRCASAPLGPGVQTASTLEPSTCL